MNIPFTDYKISFSQKTQAPMGEIASDPSVIATSLKESITQYNPDSLINRKGYAIIDKMRIDEAVKAALTLKKQAVIAPGWIIEPASDDPKDIEIAEFVEYALDKMRGSISNMLMQILLALDYGFSINEIVWKVYEDSLHKGKIGLKAIKSKKPHYYDFKVDQFGNLDKLVVNGIVQAQQELPPDKFLIYTYQKEFSNWYGQSDLRPAYRSWWSKDALLKFWNIYLEKFGQPTAWGRHKAGDKQGRKDLQTILNKLQTSTNITSSIGDFEIELIEATRNSTGDYKEALHYHDRGIARSILIPDRLSEAGETGAFSQALVHFDVFLWVVKCLRLDLEEVVMGEQLIRRLIAFNFSDVEELPRFKFKSLTDEQTIELAKTFADVVQKGAIVPTFEDENKIREILGFPEKTEEEIIEPEKESKPEKEPEEEEIEEDKEMSAIKFVARDKTRFEKTVNFRNIEKELDEREIKITKDLQNILDKQKASVIKFVTNKMLKNSLSTKDAFDLELRFKGDQKKVINQMFADLYNLGKKDSKKEIPKNFATSNKQGIEVKPDKALKFMQDKTDFVIKGINDPLTSDIQRVLVNAIDTGQSVPNTIKGIEETYQPYLEDGNVIVDNKQLQPFRLEAIVRTSMSQAYNQGRRAIGEDPDLKDFVLGYQFSEIIDSRTSEVSLTADQKTIRIDDPRLPELSYPLHWNDRGVFVFITSDEVPVEWTSDAELDQLLSLARETKP